MQAVSSLLSPFGVNSNAITDTLVSQSLPSPPAAGGAPLYASTSNVCLQKLVVIGGTVETARRASMTAWNGFVDCKSITTEIQYLTERFPQAFFLTATFSQEDYPYDW